MPKVILIALVLALASCATGHEMLGGKTQGFAKANDGTPYVDFETAKVACFNEVRPMGIQDPVVWNIMVKRCLRIKGWRK